LEGLIGPLAKDFSRITPAAGVRVSQFLESLIEKGLKNGVLFTSRMELAIKATASVPKGKNADLWATEVTEHIRLAFAMLRQMILDEDPAVKSRKSASFKRSCGSADVMVLSAVKDKMVLSAVEGKVSDGVVCSERQDLMVLSAVDDKTFSEIAATDEMTKLRDVFKRGDATLASLGALVDSDDDEISEVASTVLYSESVFDKDGFPTMSAKPSPMGSRASSVASLTSIGKKSVAEDVCGAAINADDSDDGEPVDPCSRRRKQAILGKSKASSTPPPRKIECVTTPVKSKGCVVDCKKADGPLHRAKLAITKCGRYEVTAYTIDGNVRVHITTVLDRVYGPSAGKDMKILVNKINKDNLDKASCIKLKEGLQR